MLNRQTDLSLDELLALLPEAKSCEEARLNDELPSGCIVNEIGQIFWGKSKDSLRAEEELVKILTQSREELRWIAWNYLAQLPPWHPALSVLAQEAVAAYEVLKQPSD